MSVEALNRLFQNASKGARSTVLHSLQWTLGIIVAGICSLTLGGAEGGAEVWLIKFFAIAGGAVLALLLLAFIFFAFKDPDALRSETYSLSKIAIEQGLIGDNVAGLREYVETNQKKLLTDSVNHDQDNGA